MFLAVLEFVKENTLTNSIIKAKELSKQIHGQYIEEAFQKGHSEQASGWVKRASDSD